MGYKTVRTLTVIDGVPDFDYELDISRQSEYSSNYSIFGQEIKWYGFRNDITQYSKMHPDVTFEIHNVGEEYGDIWKAVVKNGEYKTFPAKITFEEDY